MRPLLQNFLQGQLSSIEVSEALQPSNTLIDVRTSEEHFQGAIPGSRNHPLFDGLERSLIGKLYRQVGREAAVERGTSIVAPQLEKFLNPETLSVKTVNRILCPGRYAIKVSDPFLEQ